MAFTEASVGNEILAKLPPDATLASVKLAKPEDYVIGAMKHMRKCAKLHGNASLRIGILGSGQKPNYRITYELAGREEVYDSFWDNHSSFSTEGRATVGHDENWSSVAMSYPEIEKLLGTIRAK